jgi:capsular exopolysaccharide synthesis family protein
MGKIQEALTRSKATESGSKKRPAGRPVGSSIHGRTANDASQYANLNVPRLAEHATLLTLDPESLESNRVVVGSQPAGPATSYKMLRTRILHRIGANNWRTIAITSARTGAGKSLTAVNTAISLAQESNQQVILVDLDLRRPSVADVLGVHHKAGIVDYLEGKAPIEKIVARTSLDRLLILPNHQSVENSSEMLSSAKMIELVKILSHPSNSSIVLFDLPPLLETDDFLAFSPLVDAVLLIVAEGETKQTDLHRAVDLISNLDILGIILNKSRGDEYPAGYYP